MSLFVFGLLLCICCVDGTVHSCLSGDDESIACPVGSPFCMIVYDVAGIAQRGCENNNITNCYNGMVGCNVNKVLQHNTYCCNEDNCNTLFEEHRCDADYARPGADFAAVLEPGNLSGRMNSLVIGVLSFAVLALII